MTSINVALDEPLFARLAEQAKRDGVPVEELACRVLTEFLTDDEGVGEHVDDSDPLAWMGKYSNAEAQSRRIDELLAERFGD